MHSIVPVVESFKIFDRSELKELDTWQKSTICVSIKTTLIRLALWSSSSPPNTIPWVRIPAMPGGVGCLAISLKTCCLRHKKYCYRVCQRKIDIEKTLIYHTYYV
jgi:hypothetical protein